MNQKHDKKNSLEKNENTNNEKKSGSLSAKCRENDMQLLHSAVCVWVYVLVHMEYDR